MIIVTLLVLWVFILYIIGKVESSEQFTDECFLRITTQLDKISKDLALVSDKLSANQKRDSDEQ